MVRRKRTSAGENAGLIERIIRGAVKAPKDLAKHQQQHGDQQRKHQGNAKQRRARRKRERKARKAGYKARRQE